MNPLIQWLMKEYIFFMKELLMFVNYYNLRDRVPFYAFFIYILGKNNDNPNLQYGSEVLLVGALAMGTRATYYAITNTPEEIFFGFNWNYVAPIQYVILIFVLAIIGFCSTRNTKYSTALGYNGAAAIGYLYETPFWLFSKKIDKAHFIHTNHRFVFFLDYQIIAIVVFIWLLKQQKITIKKEEMIGFILAWGITFIMASKMYVWQTFSIVRIPMMLYAISLSSKMNGGIKPTLKKIHNKITRILYRLEKSTYYLSSIKNNPELSKGDVACVMCVWDEQIMVPLALESSKDFVSRYIVVDKNGNTAPIIEKYADLWNLNVEIYVKPKMSLKESRIFAISKINEPWILIQDGDEVFHTEGEQNISNLRRYMKRENVIFCSKMAVLMGDLKHTINPIPIQPPHKFLYHNNDTIKTGRNKEDLPDGDSYLVMLPGIWKFNCVIKHPKRHYLRKFWVEWCKETELYKKYPDIEDFVREELGINIEEEYEAWYKNKLESLVPYNEERYGYYPAIIRRQLN